MNQVVELPLLGLDKEFPEDLFVLHHHPTDKYACCNHKGIHGLACFSIEGAAMRFAELIDLSNMKIEEVSFEQAREVAKGRPLPVVALMLLDKMNDPIIHYVR
jgi:hypothetical protein